MDATRKEAYRYSEESGDVVSNYDDADRGKAATALPGRKRQFWRRIGTSVTGLIAVLLLTVLVYFLHSQAEVPEPKVETRYYAGYVECWGVPEGIFELTKEQTQVRMSHYRIETRDGLVRRLVHANSVGTPVPVDHTELLDRPMIAEYVLYDDKGRIRQVNSMDRNGKVLLSYVYSGDKLQTVELRNVKSDGSEVAASLSSLVSLDCPIHEIGLMRSQVGRFQHQRDERGRVTQTRFQKSGYDVFTPDVDGVAGFHYTLDDLGRVVEKTYLDVEGNPCSANDGVARRTYEYDANGNLEWTTYLNDRGEPTSNEHGWKICRGTFDNNGNCTRVEFFENDRKTLCLELNGVAGITSKYDDCGNLIEIAAFGVNGEPCLSEDGVASGTFKYDEQGNEIEQVFFGVNGEPCLCIDDYSRLTSKYDERGNEIEQACFGVDGEPCLSMGDSARITFKYDERGNEIEHTYFGVDGAPCLCADSFSKVTRKYDDRDNCVEVAFFGMDGEPCLNSAQIAGWKSEFDARMNCESKREFFGTDGKPCPLGGEDPYTGWERTFNENGKVLTQKWLYTIKPHEGVLGSRVHHYDEYWNITEVECFDLAGRRLTQGIWVGKVTEGSVAEGLGLKEGDIFVEYDGRKFQTKDEFVAYRKALEDSRPRKLVVRRGEETVELDIPQVMSGCALMSGWVPE